jgi:hypothetical protein
MIVVDVTVLVLFWFWWAFLAVLLAFLLSV